MSSGAQHQNISETLYVPSHTSGRLDSASGFLNLFEIMAGSGSPHAIGSFL